MAKKKVHWSDVFIGTDACSEGIDRARKCKTLREAWNKTKRVTDLSWYYTMCGGTLYKRHKCWCGTPTCVVEKITADDFRAVYAMPPLSYFPKPKVRKI